MTKATLISGGDRPAVRLERHLADPPAVVWRALTEREQLRSWFPCDVIVDGDKWVVGAAISFPFPAEVIDLTLAGQVLAVEEPHLLVFSWGDDTLRFELGPEDGDTRLVLVNELPPGTAARTATGWEDCLDRLAGLEPSGGSWQSRFDAYCREFESVVGPQQGPPAGYKGGQPDRPRPLD